MSNISNIEPLIDDYLRNNCTPAEYEKVIDILNNPEYNGVLQFILSKKWNEQETTQVELSSDDKKDIRQSLSNIHHEINLIEEKWIYKTNYNRILRVFVNIAATLFLPILFISIWYFVSSRNPYQYSDSYITVTTPTGSKLKTELPDGTIVWQNSGSTIKYPQNFTKRNRQVLLTGEAYFDVSSDILHPFFVKTEDMLIEVTGTKFNVTGYEDEESSSVVLESGKILVKPMNSSSTLQYNLVPGDRFERSLAKGELLNHGVNVQKYVSWKDGKLIFRDEPFEEVLRRLERWYNVDIVLNDPKGKFSGLPLNLTIQNESLPQILEYLKHAVPITIKEEKLSQKNDGSFEKKKYIIEDRNKLKPN